MQNPKPLPLSERCRALAERCRARSFRNEVSRAQMLQIATDYDQLALDLEVSPETAAGQGVFTAPQDTPKQSERVVIPSDFDD